MKMIVTKCFENMSLDNSQIRIKLYLSKFDVKLTLTLLLLNNTTTVIVT